MIKKNRHERQFELVQMKYCNYGAHDTEPSAVFQGILEDARNGIPFKSLSAYEWELFSTMPRREFVADKLNEAARICYADVFANK